jgi:hypothetical protein
MAIPGDQPLPAADHPFRPPATRVQGDEDEDLAAARRSFFPEERAVLAAGLHRFAFAGVSLGLALGSTGWVLHCLHDPTYVFPHSYWGQLLRIGAAAVISPCVLIIGVNLRRFRPWALRADYALLVIVVGWLLSLAFVTVRPATLVDFLMPGILLLWYLGVSWTLTSPRIPVVFSDEHRELRLATKATRARLGTSRILVLVLVSLLSLVLLLGGIGAVMEGLGWIRFSEPLLSDPE